MNESAQHFVPYEEILHAISLDAHACGAEPCDAPPDSPDHIDHPMTSCSHPPLACATQEPSNRKPRSPKMNEKRQINATILRQLFEAKVIRLEPGAIFDYELAPKEPDFDFERFEKILILNHDVVQKNGSLGVASGCHMVDGTRKFYAEWLAMKNGFSGKIQDSRADLCICDRS